MTVTDVEEVLPRADRDFLSAANSRLHHRASGRTGSCCDQRLPVATLRTSERRSVDHRSQRLRLQDRPASEKPPPFIQAAALQIQSKKNPPAVKARRAYLPKALHLMRVEDRLISSGHVRGSRASSSAVGASGFRRRRQTAEFEQAGHQQQTAALVAVQVRAGGCDTFCGSAKALGGTTADIDHRQTAIAGAQQQPIAAPSTAVVP